MTECFIVAGPPRSGTSLVAGLLHRLGVSMGDERSFLPANQHNPTGYFEDSHFVFLNDMILDKAGGMVWTPPPRFEVESAGRHFSDEVERRVGARATEEPWGWKDPRNCLTLPAFLPHCSPKVIICHRDPCLIAESITKMNDEIGYNDARSLATEFFGRVVDTVKEHKLPYLIMHHEITLMEPRSAVSELIKFCNLEVNSDIIQNAVEFVIPSCR